MLLNSGNKPDKSHSQDKQDKEVQAFFKNHSNAKTGLANKFSGKSAGRLFEHNQVEENSMTLLEQRMASLRNWVDESVDVAVGNESSADIGHESSADVENSADSANSTDVESSMKIQDADSDDSEKETSPFRNYVAVYTGRIVDSSAQFDREICGAVVERSRAIMRVLATSQV